MGRVKDGVHKRGWRFADAILAGIDNLTYATVVRVLLRYWINISMHVLT
jgi:hypothetical protein